MRKFIGLAVVAAFLWVAAAPTEAVQMIPGENAAKLTDVTSIFVDTTNDGVYNPTPLPQVASFAAFDATALIGGELRAIFRITGLYDNWQKAGSPYYEDGDPGQLAGLLYDLNIVDVKQLGGAGEDFTLYLAGGGRYTSQSATAGAGGRLDIWYSASETYDEYGNHDGTNSNDWVQGTDPGNDSYPGASVGSLWLRGEFVPRATLTPGNAFIGGLTYVYSVTVNVTDRKGKGSGYADVVVNNTGVPIQDNIDFQDGVSPLPGGDVSVTSNLTFINSTATWGDWQASSEDPVLVFALPEPASMSLLLVGLVGSAGAYWRRRRAA